jgi:hypothetical protein
MGLRRVLLHVGLDVGGVQLLDAGVEFADTTDHGVLDQQLTAAVAGSARREKRKSTTSLLALAIFIHILNIFQLPNISL